MTNSDLKALHVVVIDDEDFMRNIVGRMLHDIGVGEVHLAGDGVEAIGLIESLHRSQIPVDLVICDLEMPNVDGFAFVRLLRGLSNADLAKVPVLILTGHTLQENVEMAVRLGIHGFLVKPVSRDLLHSRLIKALESPPIDPARLG